MLFFKRVHIRSFEIGLLFRDGEFKGLVEAGRHWFFDPLGRVRVDVVSQRDPWLVHEKLDVIVKSGALAERAVVLDLKDHERALVWIENRFSHILPPGLYANWTGHKNVRVEVVDARQVRFEHVDLKLIARSPLAGRVLDVCTIDRDRVGVLFIDGRFVETVSPGLYAFWKGESEAKVVDVDLRETMVDVGGQEIMTADKVTLRMLINSTSGYADYVNLEILPLYEDPFRQWTPKELIDLGLSQPMKCAPGTCFAYAHTNFVILGEVLAKASGKPVDVLIREGVLKPLGLRNTRSEATPEIQAPVLHAFTSERGPYEDSTYWNPSWTLAAGSIMTADIGDTLASGIAIGTGALLTPESSALQLALAEPVMDGFSDQFYFGLGVIRVAGWVAQTPSFGGYSAAMAYLPEAEITIAVTATMNPGTPDGPRPTDVLFADLASYLSPDNVPAIKR